MPEMRILHTSDWHLGRTLYGRKRYENTAFLEWLAQAIRDNGIDVLVVAGDVFDTTAPGGGRRSCITASSAGRLPLLPPCGGDLRKP